MESDFTTTIGSMRLDVPIYNASGVYCTTYEELKKLNETRGCGAIVSKSCTLNFRAGNPEPRYRHYSNQDKTEVYSINSMGIPNNGVDYYVDAKKNINFDKPYIVSVAGLSIEENLKIFDILQQNPTCYDGIEFNLSCPNIIGKPQTGLDFEATHDTLSKVFERFNTKNTNFGLKMPPYFDQAHWNMAANVLDDFIDGIRFLTCINSIGNALVIDHETRRTAIHPKKGFGGLGGSYIKHTALANVKAFYDIYKGKVDIVGCGGVVRGHDVIEHILCGANAVQIGTSINNVGTTLFVDILSEMDAYFKRHQIINIEELKGTLIVADAA